MRLLNEGGYEVRGRGDAWREVIAFGEDNFRGEGRTEEDALDDLMRKMLPSHLAMRCASLAFDVLCRLDGPPEPPGPVAHEAHRPGGEAPLPGSCADGGPGIEDDPVDAAEPPPTEAATPLDSDVARQPTSEPPAVEPARAAPVDAYAELRALDDLIGSRLTVEVFAVEAPERQRLFLLLWIARCRALEALAPDSHEVASRGAAVARRLGDLARQYWPGTVVALRLSARPEDVAIGARGEGRPTTWHEVAERAQRALDAEPGWQDTARLGAAPEDGRERAAKAADRVGAIVLAAGPCDDAVRIALVHAARELRWLRLVAEPVRWGTAMGQLRKMAGELLAAHERPLREVLDPRTRPPETWAVLCQPKVDTTAEREREREAHLADLLDASDGPVPLLAWFVRAIELWNTPELAAVVAPVREAVIAALASEQTPGDPREDSRGRRRLVALGKELTKPTERPSPVPPPPPSEPSIAPEDPLFKRVREKLLARACGQPALLVSNVTDGDLAETLAALFGLRVETSDGSVRRVQSACQRITNGSYGLVLSATGFQIHAVDSALARAAQRAGVLYVRVNRGRPTACVQALARELGIS